MATYKRSLPYNYWRSPSNREDYYNYEFFLSKVNKHLDVYNNAAEAFNVPFKLLIYEEVAHHKKSFPESWDIDFKILKYDKRTTKASVIFSQPVRKIDFVHSFDYEVEKRNHNRKYNTYKKYTTKRVSIKIGKETLVQKMTSVELKDRRSPNTPRFNPHYEPWLHYHRMPLIESLNVLKEYDDCLQGIKKTLEDVILPVLNDAYSRMATITPMMGIAKTGDKANPWAIFASVNGHAQKINVFNTASSALLGLSILTQTLYQKSHGDMHHLLEYVHKDARA